MIASLAEGRRRVRLRHGHGRKRDPRARCRAPRPLAPVEGVRVILALDRV